ncbi:NAC domain-containing protein 82-like [Humulus lupulus]|uniref:NAC domain-containing protein 82-like n=1 Tax=Humulus lupulus TaxID=3486 RepID=UPI002B4171C7|nr:NAC domain-containing protein 82-like [Humulus lupulus]XP_062096609.1 NAC domain-containing protein 82-like [Humulus lupulus]
MGKSFLAPGFRFHPTDVELVKYYLKRKVLGKKLQVEAIAEIDIYKHTPWDLPDKSCLPSKDLKYFFFCPRVKKYASGGRMNRAAEGGYWKTTGKDRDVKHNSEVVGAIKTLVFHTGRAPKGNRTDWVMHEYTLMEHGLAKLDVVQDSYVLCVVFKKEGPGPKNGAQYGAPFVEEDWTDDEKDSCLEVDVQNVLPTREHTASSSHAPESICIEGAESCLIPSTYVVHQSFSEDDVSHRNQFVASCSHALESQDFGSSSDLGVCMAPPVRDAPPLVCGSDVLSENPPVTNNDDIMLLLDSFFVEGDPTEVNENHTIKDTTDPVHDNAAQHASCPVDANDIFRGLGDLGNLYSPNWAEDDLSGSHTLEQFTPGDNGPSYLELRDLEAPLTRSNTSSLWDHDMGNYQFDCSTAIQNTDYSQQYLLTEINYQLEELNTIHGSENHQTPK